MAMKGNNITIALATQPVVDTFTDPTTNYLAVSQLRLTIDGVTITNDEYTGSPVKNGDQIVGKKVQFGHNVKLRPPGGASPPAANAFLPGLILQAAKFTELITATAIPAAPEALGAGGTTTTATLGATAVGTADLYKGMAVLLAGQGAAYKDQMTAIRSYTAAKLAAFCETLPLAATGNYQIPKQIGYMRDITAGDPILLSHKVWLDGYRLDLMNCRVSSLRIVVPTSTLQQPAFPEIQVTYEAMISATADQAAPAITPAGSVPFFKDGTCAVALAAVGSQTFTVDVGIGVDYPPDPNKANGVGSAELISAQAKISMTRQKYLKATLDTLTMADNQAQWPFLAMWGYGAGNFVMINAPDFRFNYQNPDLGGNFITESGDLIIDAFSRGLNIVFPY